MAQSSVLFTSPFPRPAGEIPCLRTEEIAAAACLRRSRKWPIGELILAAGFFAATGGAATPPFAGGDAFIQKNCAACHNSSAPAARLDLTKLSYEPTNPDNFATWVRVHDRVAAGEMPPAPIPRPPAESLTRFVSGLKGKGMLMFFTHLSTGHKGIASAMATEPIPVRATFPEPVSSVTVSLWGSTGTPALLEGFDGEGKVIDRASLESVPGRKAPGDPVPIFSLTVKGNRIAYVQFSGPREGEYLAADEVRFTPIGGDRN